MGVGRLEGTGGELGGTRWKDDTGGGGKVALGEVESTAREEGGRDWR